MELSLSNHPAGVPATLIRTREGRVIDWSPEMERLYGFSRDEALGHTTHRLLRTSFPRALREIEATFEAHDHWSGGVIQRRACGRAVLVASHWYLDRSRGEHRGTVTEVHAPLVHTDPDRTRHFAEVLSVLTHDLSEPLTAIGSYGAGAEAVRTARTPDQAQLGRALEEIGSQSRRVAGTVRLLRELAAAMRDAG